MLRNKKERDVLKFMNLTRYCDYFQLCMNSHSNNLTEDCQYPRDLGINT